MRYTATFEIPDEDDARWRMVWSADATIESFKKVNYPVWIKYFDENGRQITEYYRKQTQVEGHWKNTIRNECPVEGSLSPTKKKMCPSGG